MIHTEFEKTLKKILIDKDMTISSFAESIGDSKQNLSQKLKRGTIRLKEAEELLDSLGYDLVIKKKN